MCVEITRAASIVIGRISALAGQDPEFRAALESVLDGLLDTRQAPNDDGAKIEEVFPSVERGERPQTEPDSDAVVMSTEPIAASLAVAPTIRRPPREPVQTDLSAIEARCRLKAEGARWAAERQRQIHKGIPFSAAIEPRDHDLIARAKQIECFLWMNSPKQPRPDDLGLFDVLASCFETVAEAATLLRDCVLDMKVEDLFRQCLDVAAEAQSALRSAVMAVGAWNDAEQQALYEWLKKTAADKGIFIERHLRSDDPADPYSWAEIQGRIQAVREACRKVLDRERQRTDWLGRIRYHGKRVASGGGTDHDWQVIAQVTDEMVKNGVPPSNLDLRDALMPIIEIVPTADGFPVGFHLVVREARNHRAEQDTKLPSPQEAVPTTEVQAVRKFLQRTSLVIIGGDSRGHAQQAIKEAFALKDVIWLDSREHQSTERFMPFITRADVKVVVLLIRWSSHSYGDLKQYCDRHGKHFVRMPAGYNANQIANQIMAQCADLLGQDTRASSP